VLTDKLHSLYVKEPESKILERSESDISPPTLRTSCCSRTSFLPSTAHW